MAKFVIWVEFDLQTRSAERFLALARENARLSVEREAGCERFDVLTAQHDLQSAALYEIYESEAAFAEHLKTEHFVAFDGESAPLILAKRAKTYSLE